MPAAKELPPQAELAQLFDYDPVTGVLSWRERPASMFKDGGNSAIANAAKWNARFAGKPITTALPLGHLYTSIWASKFLVHRIIWKLVHGEDAQDIDHINGDPRDNRLENLRSVSHQANGRNLKLKKNNSSGVTGVRWEERLNKWHARIEVSGKTVHLGVFTDIADAAEARKAAEKHYGFHENHGRVMAG